ncbi:MAG: ribonuclease III [Clostridia bacterium]|nr:ribonuclease III [Clostridia bacterium]
MNLDELQSAIGYRFVNKQLLYQAMSHPSYANQHGMVSYQRLEYLGDALLGFIVADELFSRYPDSDEGVLSKLRIELVKKSTLSEKATELGLEKHAFINVGSDGEKSRCDLYESIVAAIYKDGGIDAAKEFIFRTLLNSLEHIKMDEITDYKSALNEKCFGRSIKYITVNIGDAHNPYFESELFIDKVSIAKGQGKNKRAAEENCAGKALKLK